MPVIDPKILRWAWLLIAYISYSHSVLISRHTIRAAVEIFGLLRNGGVVSYGSVFLVVAGFGGTVAFVLIAIYAALQLWPEED